MRFAAGIVGFVVVVGLSLVAVVACTPTSDVTSRSSEIATAEVAANQTSGESSDGLAEETGSFDDLPEAENTNEPPNVPPNSNQSTADRSGIVDITFEDIKLPIDADMVFRPIMMTERAQELDGQRVRISGYMLADAELRGIKQFILLKNTECKFGPGGQADHLINVKVNVQNGAVYRTEPVSIEGVLSVNPYTGFDGNTWSIFDLACDHIEIFKPRR